MEDENTNTFQSIVPSPQPHITPLEDRQLIQIVIDSERNATEFEFREDILAKEFIIKGYSFWSSLVTPANYAKPRGHFTLDISWLKVDGITKFNTGAMRQTQKIMLPFNCGQQYDNFFSTYWMTSNLNMNYNITLPSQTAMRRRFKATVLCDSLADGEYPLQAIEEGLIFRLVLHIEVVHTHTHI